MKSEHIVRKLLLVAGCAALAWAASFTDSQAATVSTDSSGTVVTPIAISKTVDLNFGKFIPSGTAGTVVVDTTGAGTQSVSGGVTTSSGLAASARAAKFTITGEGSATYALTVPSSLNMSGTGDPILVDTLTFAVDVGSLNAGVGTLPASGPQVLTVGATAHVAASQTAGAYTGSFNVSVDYN